MSGPILAALPGVSFAGRYRGSSSVVFHDHPGLEIVLVTHGSCAVHVGEKHLHAVAGEAFILPAFTHHNQEDDGDVETAYVICTVRPQDFRDEPRVVPMPLTEAAAGWLGQLADLQKLHVPPAVRSGLALALLESLAQREQHSAQHQSMHPGLVKALHRIESDHLEDLTVNDLARAAEMSPSHLTSLFRSHVGCGPLAYMQRQRLELACRLLKNAYLSVAEVADSCGYPDANYFSRLFRQTYRCSPSDWRKKDGVL